MDLLAAALVLFLTFVLIHNKKDPKKLFGVYSQPGKWYFLKYPILLSLMVLRRLKYYSVGKKGLFNVKELERRQPLSNHPLVSERFLCKNMLSKTIIRLDITTIIIIYYYRPLMQYFFTQCPKTEYFWQLVLRSDTKVSSMD